MGQFSSRVQPSSQNSNRKMELKIYKYFLLSLISCFLVYLVSNMFHTLTASDESIYGAKIPDLPESIVSSLANKLRVSQFVWVSIMIIIKALVFVSVFWENFNFMLIMFGCEIISIIYDALIGFIFAFVCDIILLILLAIFIFQILKAKQTDRE